MPKVSVLTPVYNVAKYLPQCLDSLKAQTLDDIEFICINDGSTDDSLEILQRYAKGDPRFKIIDKQNEGYGKSMNRGVAAATGEYIGILESDDFIAPDAFERLYDLAKRNGDCDVVKANYCTFDEKHGERLVENLPADLCGRAFCPAEPGNAEVVIPTPAIWSAIYRREFLQQNGIGFLETPGAAFQDTGFVMKCYIAAERVYLTPEAYVRYRVDNAGSSVKARDRVFNVCEEYHSIEAFLAERPEKRAALITAVNAAKFNTYRWNKNRIDWDLRPEFLEVFAREFRAARDAGELDESLSIPSRWREFNEIADDPWGYYNRTRAAHALKQLAKQLGKDVAKHPAREVAIIVAPRERDARPWRLFESLCDQPKTAFELFLPRSMADALGAEGGPGVSVADDAGGRDAWLRSALAQIEAPYAAVLDDPVWYAAGALDKLLAALKKSEADFAAGPLFHAEDGGSSDSAPDSSAKPHKLNTSKLLFGSDRSFPVSLNAVDATRGNKLFRTSALTGSGALLSLKRVPKAHVLTTLRDGDLLGRVSLFTRLRYHRWFRKLM